MPAGARLAPALPGGSLLFGHGREFRDDPLGFMLRVRGKYGDIVRTRFGPMTVHLLAHPDAVRHVLQEAPRVYGKQTRGYEKLSMLLGRGLLTSDGAHWLRQRRIAQPAFHRARIEAFAEVMVRAILEMTERWASAAERGTSIDVHVEVMGMALRVVSETLLGIDVSERASDVGEALGWTLEDVNERIGSMVDVPTRIPTRRNRTLGRHLETLDRVVFEVIEARRRSQSSGEDLLGMLMDARDEETGQRMDDRQLRDEVMTIFLAGHETTANALTWTFYLLSKHPASMRRLQAEVDTVLEGRLPTIADLPRLEWTSMVLSEAMRLYPPAWGLGRTPIEDDVIDGFFIPRGSLVFVSPWVTHRHPDFWEDPEGFDPERFAPERMATIPRYAYFPFAGGPRQCIGNRFALMEAELALAVVAQRYRLDLVPGHPVELEPVITLRPRHGMRMTVHAR